MKAGRVVVAMAAMAAMAGMAVAGAAWAGGAEVLKAKGCFNCHAMDKKKVGPAYKEVAAKYKGKGEVADTLVAKLKSGKGHMKVIASEADLQAAVKYILEQQ